jgi:hypothetical protein
MVTSISRRWLLGASIAGAGALLVGRVPRGTDRRRWAGPDPGSVYLTARESPSYDQSFAAFAQSLSLGVGDELVVRARASSPVDVHVERVGWRADGWGTPPVRATVAVRLERVDDTVPPLDWPVAVRTRVSDDWESGLYMAVVTDTDDRARRRFAPFVVRAAQPRTIVVGVPFTTYHAYNAWGGASLYAYNSPDGVATTLPIARPFDVFDGAGFAFYGDWQLARWLDRERYDVSYVTSYDLHSDPAALDGARLFISAFHDEYWSTSMRERLEHHVVEGGNAVFLAANSIYWRVRLDGVTMTCHKAEQFADDPHPDITARWRSALIGKPEYQLLGSWYDAYQFPYGSGHAWTVSDADHWMYAGTGLTNGATLPGLVGYEWDHAPRPLPDNVRVLSSSEFVDADGDERRHEATERTHSGGGTVVNVGTTYWPRFLVGDAMFRSHPQVELMTHNLLRRLGNTTTD